MNIAELMGWLAAGLTLMAFSQRSMIPLRLAAIGANVSFIAYGIASDLLPILALHLTLLPCNLLRLGQLLSERRRQRKPGSDGLGVGPALWDLRCGAGWSPDEISAALVAARQHLRRLQSQVESGPALDTALALALAVARVERALPPCVDHRSSVPDRDRGPQPAPGWPQVAVMPVRPLAARADAHAERRADH